MNVISYDNPLISGNFSINNKLRVDEDGKQIFINQDIASVFGVSGFSMGFSDGAVSVTFDSDLTDEEINLLDGAVNFHKTYSPSSIENININWKTIYVDYKKARETLKVIVWTSGFNNLTLIEKKIASKWFVIPQDVRNSVHSIQQQVANGKYFHDKSVEAREKRADAGVSAMYNYLSTMDAFLVVDDVVNTYDLLNKYINFGREGKVEDGLDGLFDYLASRSGSMYENAGLLNKNIIPVGISLNQLSAAAMNIFKSGIY